MSSRTSIRNNTPCIKLRHPHRAILLVFPELYIVTAYPSVVNCVWSEQPDITQEWGTQLVVTSDWAFVTGSCVSRLLGAGSVIRGGSTVVVHVAVIR